MMKASHTLRAASVTSIAAIALLLGACGGGKGSDAGAAPPGADSGQAQTASAGSGAEGPDLSQLQQIVLGAINRDPTRTEMKVTGRPELADAVRLTRGPPIAWSGMAPKSIVWAALSTVSVPAT